MAELIYIDEIMRTMRSGRTNPTLCRGEDSKLYVVKGADTTCPGLVRELICAYLGQLLNINMPSFKCVYVDGSLIDNHPKQMHFRRTLGEGICFGSEFVKYSSLVRESEISTISMTERCSLLLFDWLICNLDRTDSNTNLLRSEDGSIRVIDHNLAFDENYDDSIYFKHHLFRDDISMPIGRGYLVEFASQVYEELDAFMELWDEIPGDWLIDEYGAVFDPLMDYSYIRGVLEERAGSMANVFGEMI